MADNTDHNGNGSATTVLVSVIIVLIIGIAFYFGFVRGNWGNKSNTGGANINVTVPTGQGGGSLTE